MKKSIIISTTNTFFQYKTTKYSNYVIGIGEHKEIYIWGEGAKDEHIETIEDQSIFFNFIELKNAFSNKNLIAAIDFYEKLIQGSSSQYAVFNINDFFNILKSNNIDSSNYSIDDVYINIIVELCDFFKTYGIPERMLDKKTKKVRLNSVIRKLDDIYEFCNKLSTIEKSYASIEIPLSNIGLMKNKDDEFQIISYFDCPFEFAKYNLLIKQVVGKRKIIQCAYCHSIIIASRSDQKFCENRCKTAYCRKKKKKN